jgi:hypothetical protein
VRIDQSRIVLRPRTPSSVADLAFRYVLDLQPRSYWWVSLWTLLPGVPGCLSLRHFFGWEWAWVWLAAIAYVSVAQGAFTLLSGRLLFEHDVPVREVMSSYLRSLLPYGLASLITRGLALALMPVAGVGLVIWSRYAFLHEAILLEGLRQGKALRRAAELGKHSGSDTASMLALVTCIHVGAALCVEALGRGVLEWLLMAPQLAEPLYDAGGSPFALIGFLGATPFTATCRFLTYIDGRTKQDGWDLQVKFMQIEAAAQEAA